MLRPDAPQPGSAASSTITRLPSRHRRMAADRPVNPAPMISTSAAWRPSRDGSAGAAGAVAAHNESGNRKGSPSSRSGFIAPAPPPPRRKGGFAVARCAGRSIRISSCCQP
ncbi:Uncharacterised protein [Bordetella pertussis]|nr:Uncharacterised protein [Bordetella pertussis]